MRNPHTCSVCGRRHGGAARARSQFKPFPPPTYKGGWCGRYVPLDAPVRASRTVLAPTFAVADLPQPVSERASINGVEVPNEKLEVLA